jgi:hypothetical protein
MACHVGAQQTQWSEWVTVPKAVCAGQLPWYQTQQGTFTNVEEIPFILAFAGSSTGIILVDAVFTVQFKSQVSPSNTPALYELRRRLKEERRAGLMRHEQVRLLSVLSPIPASSTLVQKP